MNTVLQPAPVIETVLTTGQGPAGPGLPAGGTTGQALVKVSATDQDTSWATISLSSEIHAAAAKSLPVGADEFGYLDSTNGWRLVKMPWSALQSALKTYFDTQYVLAPTLSLAASTLSVNEGGSVLFTVTTTNVTAGTTYNYLISGLESADVVGGSLTGTLTIDGAGQASVTVTLVADALTEGDQTMTFTANGQSVSVTVVDTSQASPIPADALGIWYADEYVASPRRMIPNSASVEPVSENLLAFPRRQFASSYWSKQNATFTEGIADPDGGTQATRFNGGAGGSYMFVATAPTLPAGTYTMAVTAKRHGGVDQTFVMDFYEVAQSGVKTATDTYQRFYHTATLPAGATYMFFVRSLADACDIDIIDVCLYSGTVTDQVEPPLSGHLYLGSDAWDTKPTYSSGLLDLTASAYGYLQYHALALSQFTLIVLAEKTTDNAAYNASISSYGNYAKFTPLLDNSKQAQAFFGNTDIIPSRSAPGGMQLFNKGLKCITHRYDGVRGELIINDTKLISVASSPTTPVVGADFIFGAMQDMSNTGGYKFSAVAFYDRALTDAQVGAVYAALSARAAQSGLNVSATDNVLISEGDSITASAGPASYSRLAAPDLSPEFLYANYAFAGDQIAQLNARAAMIDAIIPAAPGVRRYVLSVLIGANDLANGATAQDFLASLAAYCDARRAAGWTVLVCTVLPCVSAGVNVGRAIANPEIRLWATGGTLVPGVHADGVCDFGGDATYGQDANASDASKYYDGIHPTLATQTALKALYVAAVNAL